MAKTKNNKSQKIRDYLTENSDAKAKDVVTALGEKGIIVTESLVYGVRGAMKERENRKKRVAKAALAATPASTIIGNGKADAITMIRAVKGLAAKAGGYAKLKELVDALAE